MSSEGFIPSGMEGLSLSEAQARCDRLHFLKNRPDPPMINGEPMTFPPYQYRPFPACMYGAWTDDTKRVMLRRIAVTHGLSLEKPFEREQVEALLPEYDSRLVQDEADVRLWQARGWATEPTGVKAAEQAIYDRLAEAAAAQKFTDQNMTDKSKDEFRTADRASETHITDVPRPRK